MKHKLYSVLKSQKGKALNEKVVHYASLVKALSKARSDGLDPYQTIELSVIPWEKLVSSGQEAEKLARPIDYPKLENILQGKINIKIIQDNYDDVLRLAHSIREGKVSASLIMGKLGSYARKNSLSMALREMGRIEKTIFILDYISSEELRRRIQKGLNKGEAANTLARAVFFAKHGEFHERNLQDQMQRDSALTILMDAITVWNTVYLSKTVDYLRERNELNDELLA